MTFLVEKKLLSTVHFSFECVQLHGLIASLTHGLGPLMHTMCRVDGGHAAYFFFGPLF